MRSFLFILFGVLALFAKEIAPYKSIKVGDATTDFVRADNKLIVSTRESSVMVYDLLSGKLLEKITIPTQRNILGDTVGIIVTSVDALDGKIIFATRHLDSWGDIYMYEQKKLTKLLDASQKIAPKEIKFASADQIIIGTMENEIILFDMTKRAVLYKKHLSEASFSDFVLSEDKKVLFSADEAPTLYKIETKSGEVIERYDEANKRDIFAIDYKNGILATGGKDKRLVLYSSAKSHKTANADFFISSLILSQDANKVAFSKNEAGDLAVVDTKNLKETVILKGHTTKVIKMEFLSSGELLTADDRGTLYFWKI